MPYQDASISKQFTATALLLLEDQGKLTLDDAIARYVPGITQGDQITIRQLLSHTSGLQDYWPQDYSFAAMEHPITRSEERRVGTECVSTCRSRRSRYN